MNSYTFASPQVSAFTIPILSAVVYYATPIVLLIPQLKQSKFYLPLCSGILYTSCAFFMLGLYLLTIPAVVVTSTVLASTSAARTRMCLWMRR